MAVEKITRAKGIIYRAVWVNPITGRRESKSFDNELDAKQHEIDRRKAASDDPQAFSGPPPSTTFSSIALRYLKEADLSETTKDVDRMEKLFEAAVEVLDADYGLVRVYPHG